MYFDPLYGKIREEIDAFSEEWDMAHATILDVACGTGEVLLRLKRQYPEMRMTGADLAPKMLEKARRKPHASGIQWVEADVAHLPFPDRSFDIVLCSEAFHHFFEPEAALSEIRRVLSDDGRFLLVDPAANTWRGKAFLNIFGRMFEVAKKYYSNLDLELLLSRHGFQTLRHAVFWRNNFFVCQKL